MPPTSKENEVLVATPEAPTAAPATFRPDETASRPSPVALEVPVSVNGARAVEGSDKREPFSEATKTVLVFGNGAVIRLSSPVAAGQLLFLTNEKTKKEVVCQVVKSKNYRNVSGYVELEFTESVVGFWGMRFPTDRVAAPSSTATSGVGVAPVAKPSTVAPAVAPKAPVVPPVASTMPTVQQVAPGKVAPIAAPPQAVAPKTPPPAPTAKTPEVPGAPTMAASLASSVASLLSSPEVPPAATPKAPVPPPVAQSTSTNAGEASTEELKQQAARLQEQLSSMLFGANSGTPQQTPASAGNKGTTGSEPAASLTTKVLEIARPEPLAPQKLTSPAKPAPPAVKSSLDSEEVKIPSWLEPLARNAAAPTSTQELIEREKARHAAELAAREREEAKPEPLAVATVASEPVVAPEPEVDAMAGLPPLEGESLSQPEPAGSKRGLWIGIAAAGILAAAGGAWYFLHPGNAGQSAGTQNGRVETPAATAPAQSIQPSTQPPVQPASQTVTTASQPVSKPAVSQPLANAPLSAAPIRPEPVPLNRDNRGSNTPIPAASTERIARSAPPAAGPAAVPAKPEPKKSSLGDVHLASPTVSRSANGAEDGLAAPSISSGTDASGSGLGSGLAVGAAGEPAAPKAPLPVGGDVKPAKLLSSTAPVYPQLAKTQHVAGDISIDALIDANGKVTTMKVLSGPTLLRQAAMDAVHQWKYQPATLDGNAVAMHLTVTVHFRIQ